LIENYGPISRLSTLPKILEKIMTPKLTAIFFNTISDKQHGLRHSKSTLTNLLVYYTDIVSLVGKGIQVNAIYTDIRKAFDSIDIPILLNELEYNSISDPILKWFKSYLIDRTQQVKLGSFSSSIINVTSGVPQGGHLSPFLFLLFMNDVNYIFKYCKF
jgi:hypothetical protein